MSQCLLFLLSLNPNLKLGQHRHLIPVIISKAPMGQEALMAPMGPILVDHA